MSNGENPGPVDISRRALAILVLAGLSVGAGLGGAALGLVRYHLAGPETVLPLILILGVVVLISALGAYAVILNGFGLADKTQALGLPEGSIRAVLALALVLVFAILATFLFFQQARPENIKSTGLTAEQIKLLPAGQIIQIVPAASPSPGVPSPAPSGAPEPSGAPTTSSQSLFDVQVQRATPASSQIALQLITILGTLVTAVAAFYFGASTVKDAQQKVQAIVDSTVVAPKPNDPNAAGNQSDAPVTPPPPPPAGAPGGGAAAAPALREEAGVGDVPY